MVPNPIARYHELVASQDARGLDLLLAEDVVFHSPVVHTPQAGKGITTKYLTAAIAVLVQLFVSLYPRVVAERAAVLEFQVDIDGVLVNGVDMIGWNDNDEIVEFKVMIRPLKAVQLVHQKMAEVLATM